MAKVPLPKSAKGWVVAVVGGLVGLCLIFACLSSLLSPSAKTPSQTADVPERAVAPVALDTPTRVAAIRTPVPVTATPIPVPTEVPTVAPTAIPTSTPVPVTGPSASKNANLRSGPGTGFAVAGSVQPGQKLEVIGRTPAGDWLKLATGLWIASSLVNDAPDVPVVEVPTAPAAPPTATSAPAAAPTVPPAPPGPATINDVRLVVIRNSGEDEILEIRNAGQSSIDISNWELRGSIGDDFCTIPGGTVLQAGAAFQVATGDSQVTGSGMKCGDKPIWNNEGETITLKAPDGQVIQLRT